MPDDVIDPFDTDIEKHGAYQYSGPGRRSSVHANRRYSNVILGSTNLDGRRVVDVGCGDGAYTVVLREESSAAHVLGIDPASRAIALASKKHTPKHEHLEFRNCFAADLAREGQHFDIAIYRGVIHHVSDPATEIATALNLADEVFFLEPNGWHPVVKILERFSAYHREHKERSYRIGQYRRWIAEAGGRVKSSFYFGLVPMFSPDWFVSVASRMEPLVEALPLVRVVCCGQIGILASAR